MYVENFLVLTFFVLGYIFHKHRSHFSTTDILKQYISRCVTLSCNIYQQIISETISCILYETVRLTHQVSNVQLLQFFMAEISFAFKNTVSSFIVGYLKLDYNVNPIYEAIHLNLWVCIPSYFKDNAQ